MAMCISGFCLILLTIALLLRSIILLVRYCFTYWSRRGIDTVSPTFFFGNSGSVIFRKEHIGINTKHFYNELKRRGKKCGGYYFCLRPFFVPIDINLIKDMMTNEFNNFTDHIGHVDEINDPLTTNLFHMKGDRWKLLRAKLTPSFTLGKVRMMFSTVQDSVHNLIELFEELVEKNEVIHVKDVIARYTSDIVVSCGFGVEDVTLKNTNSEFLKYQRRFFATTFLRSLYVTFMFVLPEFFALFGIKVFDRDMTEFFINLVKDTVKYREENNIIRKDFMHFLLQIKNNVKMVDNELGNLKCDNEEISLSINEMAGQCFVFYFAGHETSATVLTFALLELALNSSIQDKLRAEINVVVEKYNGKVTYDSMNEMKYLEQCVSETLRKYAPIPVNTRVCTQTYTIPNTDITITKGTHILIPIYGIHHDPEFYPAPDKYDPERFSEEGIQNRPPLAYMPFGSGPRMCIGYKFGLLHIKCALVALLRQFSFAVHEDTKTPIQFNATVFVPTATPSIKLVAKKLDVN